MSPVPIDRLRAVRDALDRMLAAASPGPWQAHYHPISAPAPSVVTADWSLVFWPDHDPEDRTTHAAAVADCVVAALAPTLAVVLRDQADRLLAQHESQQRGLHGCLCGRSGDPQPWPACVAVATWFTDSAPLLAVLDLPDEVNG